VSGAIGGGFSPFPLSAAEKIAIPVLAGLYGTITEKAINGDRVTGGELLEASVWNAVWDNLPTKYFGPLGRRKLFTNHLYRPGLLFITMVT